MAPDTLPPFPGFRAEAFDFLRNLKAHNERDWFKPRKATYDDELLWPARCLVGQLSHDAPAAGVPVRGEPRKNVFRVYRDTRFSKNKAPYKTHLGLSLTRSGHKDGPGGLYVHVEPEGCFLAAGFWSPDGPALRRWRERLVGDPDGFLRVVEDLESAGLTPGAGPSGTLKRMPRGYEDHADAPIAPYLKWKGTVASRSVADADVQTPAFADDIVAFGRAALPLLEWGWAVEGEGG